MDLTKQYVQQAFQLWQIGQSNQFFEEYVDDNVVWTITGTNVLAGTTYSKSEFLTGPLARIRSVLKPKWVMLVDHIFVDGDTAIIEMRSTAEALDGLPYDNAYCWIMRFSQGKVVEARVYYDDVLVDQTFSRNA